MHRDPQMSYHHSAKAGSLRHLPEELPRGFHIDVKMDGQWTEFTRVTENHHRQVRIPVGQTVEGVRYTLDATQGPCKASNVYAFYVDEPTIRSCSARQNRSVMPAI